MPRHFTIPARFDYLLSRRRGRVRDDAFSVAASFIEPAVLKLAAA